MVPNKRFGELLDEGLFSVAKRQRKTLAAVEKEVATELGYSEHTIQHWRRGNLPLSDEYIVRLAKFCVERGRLNPSWVKSFMIQAGYLEVDKLLTELFPEKFPLPQKKHVFICYARQSQPDERLAFDLARGLSREYSLFYDQVSVANADWVVRVQAELAYCDFFILLLSAQASVNEVVQFEVEKAVEIGMHPTGKPRMMVVRLSDWNLAGDALAKYLNGLEWTQWDNAQDTPRVLREIMSALQGKRLRRSMVAVSEAQSGREAQSAATLSFAVPGGAMAVDSPFYVHRETDQVAQDVISTPGITVVIKGPRQIGKSSLLNRLQSAARSVGKRVLLIDFQMLKSTIDNQDTFYRQFCKLLAYALEVDDRTEKYWQLPLANPFRCSEFVSQSLLKVVPEQLLLALDEVESLFSANYRGDFFSMLRAWHNRRAFDPVWKRLDLVLVTSTEPYLFIEDLNQSPFNVGEVIELMPFSRQQVDELNQRHRAPLDLVQINELHHLVAGHPYLIHRALYLLATKRISSAELFGQAGSLTGPFGDHLRSILLRLHARPTMVSAMQQIIQEGVCPNEMSYFRLNGAGLVLREGAQVYPSSPLYETFFRQVLNVR